MIFTIERLQRLYQKIDETCKKSARNAKDVDILAATKYADVDQINQILGAGIKLIGENRIQDAQKKIPQLLPVRKHFIGTLQSNKIRTAIKLFDLIESVDSLELAEKINHEAEKLAKVVKILIEVNVAQDLKKHGVKPKEVFQLLQLLKKYPFIKVEGLMTIIPYFADLEETRPFFRMMKVLFDFCRSGFPSMHVLSMGMSHDFTVAIEEGATEVRIGSYLFKDES